MNDWILMYLIFINSIGFLLMGWDKWKARLQKWRVQEKKLWLVAFLGGAIGATVGMYLFRHKTKHATFRYGLPILSVVEGILFTLFVLS
jgi:uncharacterized membrane protein YsdA (DUF1294 family)